LGFGGAGIFRISGFGHLRKTSSALRYLHLGLRHGALVAPYTRLPAAGPEEWEFLIGARSYLPVL